MESDVIELVTSLCTVGILLNLVCHSEYLTKKKQLIGLDTFTEEECFVLAARAGLPTPISGTICSHHQCVFLNFYSRNQQSCCDPFSRHGKSITTNLRVICLQLAMSTNCVSLIPGKKLCCNCLHRLKVRPSNEAYDDDVYVPFDNSADEESTEGHEVKKARTDLNALDGIIDSLRGRIASSNSYDERVSLLTLAPLEWNRETVSDRFGVSEYMVRQARKLRQEKGVLEERNKRSGREMPEEVKKSALSIYEDDEYSKCCPGQKEFVLMRNENGEKVRYQKRLILMNLKELYSAWKTSRGESGTCGFSLFASLRPKWCVLAGAAGNVRLLGFWKWFVT